MVFFGGKRGLLKTGWFTGEYDRFGLGVDYRHVTMQYWIKNKTHENNNGNVAAVAIENCQWVYLPVLFPTKDKNDHDRTLHPSTQNKRKNGRG